MTARPRALAQGGAMPHLNGDAMHRAFIGDVLVVWLARCARMARFNDRRAGQFYSKI